eukprot:scaffold1821_cov344-Pavlova_lutheri.AAC.4
MCVAQLVQPRLPPTRCVTERSTTPVVVGGSAPKIHGPAPHDHFPPPHAKGEGQVSHRERCQIRREQGGKDQLKPVGRLDQDIIVAPAAALFNDKRDVCRWKALDFRNGQAPCFRGSSDFKLAIAQSLALLCPRSRSTQPGLDLDPHRPRIHVLGCEIKRKILQRHRSALARSHTGQLEPHDRVGYASVYKHLGALNFQVVCRQETVAIGDMQVELVDIDAPRFP